MKQLAEASLKGGMGLLIGTGFSRAATKRGLKPALSWKELLEAMAAELDLEFPPTGSQGMSYPRMASEFARTLRDRIREESPTVTGRAALQQATSKVKEVASRLTAFQPNPVFADPLGSALDAIQPAWIVTTNYDLLIEQLLPDSDVLLPSEVIPARAGITPVYHLHGHRLAPASLVLTEEDYVETFRFGEYRQIKLSLLFSESTTLLVGYGLGDVNVLTAIDWARSYSSASRSRNRSSTGSVIQTLWTPEGSDEPAFWGDHDELIIPITEITSFLEEIRDARAALEKDEVLVRELVDQLETDENGRHRFLWDSDSREKYLDALVDYSSLHGNRKPLELLDSILEPEEAWDAAPFEVVRPILEAILDIFERWTESEPHPALFNALAGKLGEVSWYIGKKPHKKIFGHAWAAQRVWHDRKQDIPARTRRMLRTFAVENGYSNLVGLLDQIETA